MTSFYDATAMFQRIDDGLVPVLLLAGGALAANVVWFLLALRAGERDRLPSTALLAILVFLPHDVSYLVRFDTWFSTYDHWFPRLFWVALFVPVTFELLYLRQFLRYGHREMLPQASRRVFVVLVLAATALSFPAWELVKAFIGDPLYLGSFTVLILLSPMFGIALASRRGDGRGQSVGMWQAYTVMAALWGVVILGWFGPDFRSWPVVGAVVGSVAGGLVATWVARPATVAGSQLAPSPSVPVVPT